MLIIFLVCIRISKCVLFLIRYLFIGCVFEIVMNCCRCNVDDIFLEMDRILCLEGVVIIRDDVDILIKVKRIIFGMRWDLKLVDYEDGFLVNEKVLIVVK